MIPRPLTNQTLDDVLGDKSNWMLVDTSLVSYDGQACDKVGTSFGAFRNQANGCKRAPQVSQAVCQCSCDQLSGHCLAWQVTCLLLHAACRLQLRYAVVH